MSYEPSFSQTPVQALQQLRDGNSRFLTGGAKHPRASLDYLRELSELGSWPCATILSCSDSRVPPELIFDQGFGDLFIIRVAGNICAADEVGSIEFGIALFATPLVVVMGHTRCGAVTAVATGAEVHGSIPKLVEPIAPALATAQASHPTLSGAELVPYVIEANMWQAIADLLRKSPDVVKHIKADHVMVIGALYDVETGTVRFLGEHPRQTELLG